MLTLYTAFCSLLQCNSVRISLLIFKTLIDQYVQKNIDKTNSIPFYNNNSQHLSQKKSLQLRLAFSESMGDDFPFCMTYSSSMSSLTPSGRKGPAPQLKSYNLSN